eukprot:SAG22_NODE_721_length_7648_cov_9.418466_4_plen_161_part_00
MYGGCVGGSMGMYGGPCSIIPKLPLEVEIAMGVTPVPISVSSGNFALRYEVPKFLPRGDEHPIGRLQGMVGCPPLSANVEELHGPKLAFAPPAFAGCSQDGGGSTWLLTAGVVCDSCVAVGECAWLRATVGVVVIVGVLDHPLHNIRNLHKSPQILRTLG